jgi:hypothetical protein
VEGVEIAMADRILLLGCVAKKYRMTGTLLWHLGACLYYGATGD